MREIKSREAAPDFKSRGVSRGYEWGNVPAPKGAKDVFSSTLESSSGTTKLDSTWRPGFSHVFQDTTLAARLLAWSSSLAKRVHDDACADSKTADGDYDDHFGNLRLHMKKIAEKSGHCEDNRYHIEPVRGADSGQVRVTKTQLQQHGRQADGSDHHNRGWTEKRGTLSECDDEGESPDQQARYDNSPAADFAVKRSQGCSLIIVDNGSGSIKAECSRLLGDQEGTLFAGIGGGSQPNSRD